MGWSAGWLRGVRDGVLIVGLCLLLYLPGISAIPPLDRDEARFAQSTRQMLDTGDLALPRALAAGRDGGGIADFLARRRVVLRGVLRGARGGNGAAGAAPHRG